MLRRYVNAGDYIARQPQRLSQVNLVERAKFSGSSILSARRLRLFVVSW